MSFSRTTKEELTRILLRGERIQQAQLFGLLHSACCLQKGCMYAISFVTETHAVACSIASLSEFLYGTDAELSLHSTAQKRSPYTEVKLTGSRVKELIMHAGLLNTNEVSPQQALFEKLRTKEEHRAFLRGVFLSSGSCSNPRRTYHLEIVCKSEAFALALCKMMAAHCCEAKTVPRKDRVVVYLKEGDKIAALLAFLGACSATLAFEDARAERELRNYINRTSNCETANIGKTVYAAGEQLDAINRILKHSNYTKLSPVLRETVELRLNYPQASLQELASIAGVGKSGMNHRLQRLIRLSRELT